METIEIKYFSEDVPKIKKIEQGDWIDLYAADDFALTLFEHKYIPLGIGMKLPEGYEAYILPRSSLIKKGIICANSMGMIDNSYSGENDQWHFSALCISEPKEGWDGYFTNRVGERAPYVYIHKGERICQFRIMKSQPEIEFKIVDKLSDKSRGGLGSTGGYKND